MNRQTDLNLMRLLHGELPEDQARALRVRLDQEPELAEAWRRLEAGWRGLDLPPASPVPPGFAQRVAASARQEAAGLSWAQAPGWVRAAAAAVLVIGAAVGAGVGGRLPAAERAQRLVPTLPAPAPRVPAVGTPAPAETPAPRAEAAAPALETETETEIEIETETETETGGSLAESYWEALDDLAAGGDEAET